MEERANGTLVAALEHARAVILYDIELRVKNFNFFLVITGLLVAGYFKEVDLRIPIALAGVLASSIFLILDVRTAQFIEHAHAASVKAEKELGISPSPFLGDISGPEGLLGRIGRGVVSHTFAYRALFMIAAAFFLASLLAP